MVAGRGAIGPTVTHASAACFVKGEDVLSVHPLGMLPELQSSMYMICDGHSKADAAIFVSQHLHRLLDAALPRELPDFARDTDVSKFAEAVRKALCETFLQLDNEWTFRGLTSGTTCTVALVTGWLITVANVGDSSAVLDTGASMLELTKSHRLQDSLEEQARLREAECVLAPLGMHLQGPAKAGQLGVGPLRLWPGGLCVGRSLGDLDAGPMVMPLPNIRQVMIPDNGCRLIMASDGLWDIVTLSKACKLTRSSMTDDAVARLMHPVRLNPPLRDDTTIVVIDALPPGVPGWPSVVLRSGDPNGSGNGSTKGGGVFSCFRPEVDEPDSRSMAGLGHLAYFADVDTLTAFPHLKAELRRATLGAPGRPGEAAGVAGAAAAAQVARPAADGCWNNAMCDFTSHNEQPMFVRIATERAIGVQRASIQELPGRGGEGGNRDGSQRGSGGTSQSRMLSSPRMCWQHDGLGGGGALDNAARESFGERLGGSLRAGTGYRAAGEVVSGGGGTMVSRAASRTTGGGTMVSRTASRSTGGMMMAQLLVNHPERSCGSSAELQMAGRVASRTASRTAGGTLQQQLLLKLGKSGSSADLQQQREDERSHGAGAARVELEGGGMGALPGAIPQRLMHDELRPSYLRTSSKCR